MSIITSELEIPPDYDLADCAVSGGSLKAYIQALSRITHGKMCLVIRRENRDFPLPARDGMGRSLSQQELETLKEGRTCRFSPVLCAEYFTYLDRDTAHVVLFDTERSIREKLRTAEEWGKGLVMVEDPALRNLLGI